MNTYIELDMLLDVLTLI